MSVVFDKLQTLKPTQIFLKKRVDNDFLVVANYNQELYYLNHIAREFYEYCTGEKTLLAIYEQILGEYDVDNEVLKTDLVELVRDFQWKNLLELQELV